MREGGVAAEAIHAALRYAAIVQSTAVALEAAATVGGALLQASAVGGAFLSLESGALIERARRSDEAEQAGHHVAQEVRLLAAGRRRAETKSNTLPSFMP